MNKATTTITRLLTSAFGGAMLLTLAGGASAAAQVNVQVPAEAPGVPAYTRTDLMTGQFLFHTEEWAAIVFYREPSCVPDDFNLLAFYDFTLVGDPPLLRPFLCPMTVSGREIWQNGPPVDLGPRQSNLNGVKVPVWFVSWPDLQLAIADGVLTMAELESLNPLRGVAATFHETLHPAGVANRAVLTITASGLLPDGRSFQYHFTAASNQPRPTVRIGIR
jgi:hypothetical protein